MKNKLLSAPARTDILFGIVVLALRFLIFRTASSSLVLLPVILGMWLVAWAAIIIGMAKLGKREDWKNRLRERARENALLSAAVSASARMYIIAGVALHVLLLLLAVVLPANFAVEAFRYLIACVAWAAIAIAIVRIGSRKGWWDGLSERTDLAAPVDLKRPRLFQTATGRLVTGIALIVLGLIVRSNSFMEVLIATEFLMDLVVELDQGLWPLYEPLYTELGSALHDFSPTLGVLGWLGILSGIALAVVAVIQMRDGKETRNKAS